MDATSLCTSTDNCAYAHPNLRSTQGYKKCLLQGAAHHPPVVHPHGCSEQASGIVELLFCLDFIFLLRRQNRPGEDQRTRAAFFCCWLIKGSTVLPASQHCSQPFNLCQRLTSIRRAPLQRAPGKCPDPALCSGNPHAGAFSSHPRRTQLLAEQW